MNVKHCLKCAGNGYYYNGVPAGTRDSHLLRTVDIVPERVSCERCDGTGHFVMMSAALRALLESLEG